MTLDEAFAVADAPTRHNRAHLALALSVLSGALRGELERRTLGGTPPGYQVPGAWAGTTHVPPSSATAPDAPPLRTERGSDHQEHQP